MLILSNKILCFAEIFAYVIFIILNEDCFKEMCIFKPSEDEIRTINKFMQINSLCKMEIRDFE